MNKQKRMIYIYEENVEFYNSLENKSEFINEQLKNARLGLNKPQTPGEKARETNMSFVKRKLADIEAKNRRG